MTQPMPYRRRFLIVISFILLFIVFFPLVILYSTGYRLDKDFTLFSTGGIYVFYPESGAQLSINEKASEQTSLFSRGIFVDDLDPDTYSIELSKPGYLPWKKTVEVKAKKVTEGYPFLIPQTLATSSIPKFVTLTSGASVTDSLYGEVVQLFATSTASSSLSILKKISNGTTTSIIATSTVLIKKDVEVTVEGNSLVASWRGGKDSMPFYFCDAARLSCQDSFVVLRGLFKKVRFYPGRNDVVLYTTKDGLYVTELDTRPPQNTRKLLSGSLDFEEKGDRIFVHEKSLYYELIFTASTTLNSISI